MTKEKKTSSLEERREDCAKELGEVLKKHGFGLQAINPQPVINLVPIAEETVEEVLEEVKEVIKDEPKKV